MTRRTQKGKGLVFANGGTRTAMLQPRFGGNQIHTKKRTQRGRGCDSCGAKPPMMPLPPGITPSRELLRGGSCGCGGAPTGRSPWRNLTGGHVATITGGACPCEAVSSVVPVALGGYKPTKRNLKYLTLWKQGKSIGFTMRSSLKAKGLIPRANGTYKVSPKYKRTK